MGVLAGLFQILATGYFYIMQGCFGRKSCNPFLKIMPAYYCQHSYKAVNICKVINN